MVVVCFIPVDVYCKMVIAWCNMAVTWFREEEETPPQPNGFDQKWQRSET